MNRRIDYNQPPLDEPQLARSPIEQLRRWISAALEAGVLEPECMCVSTVGPDGRPSSRFVLLRGIDERGLVFFTNYESRKGREISSHPWAAAAIWWSLLQRQVRVEGQVERVTAEESDAYFYSRPLASRVSAAASPQSRPVKSREELERRVTDVAAKHPEGDIPRPPHWGGYRIRPDRFEFWQGRPGRLHDRLVYELVHDAWTISRLAP